MYQINLAYTSNAMDDFPGTHSALGPNGETITQLITAGWGFIKLSTQSLSITRPAGLQVQPLINIMTHGKNSTSYISKSPSASTTGGYAAEQVISGSTFTTLNLTGLSNSNTGVATSGASILTITFGLIS